MQQNLFDGDRYQAQFAVITYRWLMSRRWVTYADIMAEFMGLDSAEQLPYGVSKCEHIGELRKAFPEVCRALEEKEGIGCIKEEGNKRNKRFCYVGKDDDPLAGLLKAVFRKDLNDYYQFCQDSAGFFPDSWIEHFFDRTLDLFEIKQRKKKGHELIGSEMTRLHKNIEWLPFIYECIRDHKVLKVAYHKKYQIAVTVIFHPHYLKEFNGRWHILGSIERIDSLSNQTIINEGQNIPLDRIDEKPTIIYDIEYLFPSKIKYPEYFNDIVGVTHVENEKLHDIVVRIHDKYMFGLVETKPIHHSQRTLKDFDETLGYAEVTMTLKTNNEFFGRILQLGHDLEIVSPKEVRDDITLRISKMNKRYMR